MKVLKNFKGSEFIDMEIVDNGDKPTTLVIRQKTIPEEDPGTPPPLPDEIGFYDIDNPNISENISYKDLLDNLN